MHNKEYALKLVQDKINGLNNYSYSQIANLTGYKKLQIVRFSNQLKEKDIDSIFVHGLTNKPSIHLHSKKLNLLRTLRINIQLLVYHSFKIFIMKMLFGIQKWKM
mgnify:CR=1 FL=1